MNKLATGLAVALLSVGAAAAQTTPPSGTQPQDTHQDTQSMGTQSMGSQPTGAQSMSAKPGTPQDKAAAGGDSNQAVATTHADANTPAHGANSFTRGQAASRIQARGYANVSGLKLDQNGVWHGQATKDGQTAEVWLDYKGNVGQRQM
jgi:hypothetical protein